MVTWRPQAMLFFHQNYLCYEIMFHFPDMAIATGAWFFGRGSKFSVRLSLNHWPAKDGRDLNLSFIFLGKFASRHTVQAVVLPEGRQFNQW